jgi:hypothetical protein
MNPGVHPVERQRLIPFSGNGAMHSDLFDPSQLQLFAIVPQHVLVVAAALVALWVLLRWGGPLLLLYAVARLWVGEWGEATIAFLFAILIEQANAFASWLEWNAHGRDEWLRQHRRDHARH